VTADKPAKLTRVRNNPAYDDAFVFTDVLDGLIVDETIEFTPDKPASVDDMVGILGPDWTGGLSSTEFVRRQRARWVPPVETVLVDDNIGTPVFDSVNADCQPGRTPKGRISRKPPKLPYTGGVAYQVFVDGSRDDHSTYHGGRR
jgi:hypothetical protein